MGIGGGQVSRVVLDAGGDGFAFFASFFVQEAEARVFHGVDLVFDGPGRGVDDSRLYLNLARFEGMLGGGSASGQWTCGPFDVDVGGYVDMQVTVRGTCRLTPITAKEFAALLDR